MKKYANFMILPELRLILECCKGKASVEDSIQMKREELLSEQYNSKYNIIVDFREFETIIDATTSKSIIIFFNFLEEINIRGKVAFLTKKPHQVVISEILKRLGKNSLAIDIEIFSSPEAAINYFGFSFSDHELIKNKIIELNRNTV